MSECHRCAVAIAPTAIEAGVAVLLGGHAYCDPCSDVMFGILSPAKAPKPRPSPSRFLGDTVEAEPLEIEVDSGDEELIEDVSEIEIDEGEDLEDMDADSEVEEVDAPLVSADEDIDTNDVELASDLEIDDMEPALEEATDTDTGTATVEVDAGDQSDFEPLENVDVNLEVADELVAEDPMAEETLVEDAEATVMEEFPVEEVQEEATEDAEEAVSVEDEAVEEASEDLPDYMEEGAAEDPEAPVLDETEEEKAEDEDRQRKKEAIEALKSRPQAHTKGGKKSRKKATEESAQEKAAGAEQRSQERSKSRDRAAVSKKRNLIIIGVAGLLCLSFGGLFVWQKFIKKKEVQVVQKAIPTYEAEQARVVELFAKADAAFAELEQMGDSDVEARNTKIREVKALYIDIKQFGTEWHSKVEADNQLSNAFEEEFGRYMDRAGERIKYVSTMIKHSVE